MEKLSGLKLDVHDDADGEVLKSIFPSYEQLPDMMKNASVLSEATRAALPDDVFALVLHDGDTVLRKYACVDQGNTALNIAYFLSTANKLPVEAQKVAAANLCTACHWYDIEPPEELKKMALGSVALIGRQRIWKDMEGDTYHSTGQSWGIEKDAEVTGTADMPLTGVPSRDLRKIEKGSKVGSADALLAEAFGVKEADATALPPLVDAKLPEKDNMKSEPQVKKVLTPHVDVSSKEPPKVITEKEASYFALPTVQRYPIDTFSQVKTADLYFQDQWKKMEPELRREYCYNLVKRAEALSQPVSEAVKTYGQEGVAKFAHVQVAIESRKLILAPHAEQGFEEEEKVASVNALELYDQLLAQYGQLGPNTFAATLGEIDKMAGIDHLWDGDICDPYYAVFAKLSAEEPNPKDAVVLGNEYMRVKDLVEFANSKPEMIKTRFGCDFTEEFQKDPTAIFDSLPQPQKLVIMRMVNNSHSSVYGASAS